MMFRKSMTLQWVVVGLVVLSAAALSTAQEPEKKKEKAAPKIKDFGKAPDKFRVKFETSQGEFVLEVTRAWSPNGADRFYNLVQNKFYDECRFFRVLDGFVAQVGINGDPAVQKLWREKTIKDDKVVESNKRGTVTFAKSSLPNSRSTQIFFNYADRNTFLDKSGFSPFGKVVKGMDVLDELHKDYGEGPPGGNGPSQSKIQTAGNEYLKSEFPKLDFIETARIVKDEKKKKD